VNVPLRNLDFSLFAFCVRAFAAALEALIAIALRSIAVSDFARASPPRLASADKYLEIADLRMWRL
jgi:hypothetical protein